ncbi:MAG TPA: hypothetical protein PKO06_04650 [Candidatus Ozemobacteraceae bacterium]|nr:hypothetical protein [Candidatus Ozemobacteraceae bacterium]
MQVSAGSLTVGTKVIYPGGPDQPPKEKDTGVSLKAEVVGISDESDVADPTSASATEDLALLAESGRYEDLLEQVEEPKTTEQIAWKALALWETGSEHEARVLATQALKEKNLPRHLREKLETTFEVQNESEPAE